MAGKHQGRALQSFSTAVTDAQDGRQLCQISSLPAVADAQDGSKAPRESTAKYLASLQCRREAGVNFVKILGSGGCVEMGCHRVLIYIQARCLDKIQTSNF